MAFLTLSRNFLALSLIVIVNFYFVSSYEENIAKAEIQSCSGCSLNRLPEVKAFIYQDVPKYEDVVFKHIQGAPPELVLFDEKYEELDRIPLRDLSRDKCNSLLREKGFRLKEESVEKADL